MATVSIFGKRKTLIAWRPLLAMLKHIHETHGITRLSARGDLNSIGGWARAWAGLEGVERSNKPSPEDDVVLAMSRSAARAAGPRAIVLAPATSRLPDWECPDGMQPGLDDPDRPESEALEADRRRHAADAMAELRAAAAGHR